MRKFTFLLIALTMLVGVSMAQDAGKLVKSGTKSLANYVSDNSNVSALSEAMDYAEQATKADPELYSGWLLKADAQAAKVNASAAEVEAMRAKSMLSAAQGTAATKSDFSAITFDEKSIDVAINAYTKAYTTATKSSHKSKAVNGMQQLSASLSSLGNAMLDGNDYTRAYAPLKQMMVVDKFYTDNGEKPLFSDDVGRNQQRYILAVVAKEAGQEEEAMKLHKQLYEAGTEEPRIYANYSSMLINGGMEKEGLAVLAAGREKFANNSDMLFAEINYYINKQDFATLEGKLQSAIAAEPNNVGLYNALGNVYLNLSQAATDPLKSDDYMKKSINYYKETIERDDKNVDAIYSIGSSYFNKAVAKVDAMNKLGTSKSEQAEYDKLNMEITELFKEALPYFEQAEQIDPDDRNTLIALKEIYARQNNFEKSKIYKERLDKM